jgi:hypothetical protein
MGSWGNLGRWYETDHRLTDEFRGLTNQGIYVHYIPRLIEEFRGFTNRGMYARYIPWYRGL